MRALKLLACFALALGVVVVAPACSDDDPPDAPTPTTPTPTTPTPDAGPTPVPDGGVTITRFVRELILTETADNKEPTTTEDKTLEETSSREDFPSEFFQQ